ncbi:MAG: futalosine hydrolase [Acidobacteriota bacterium]|nr:futalosine hydrolase [Acidobacteriota bacterium]
MTLVVCVATKLEAAGLPDTGSIAGTSFRVVRTGVGPVNAALGLARTLVSSPAEEVRIVSLGVCGAYPGSGIAVGSVVTASSECYGDLGADSPGGFLDMESLGFPVVGEHFNSLPVDLFPTQERVPFVTRSTCTGTDRAAREIAARTGGAVESMEGAAIVHTAVAHGLSVGEVRGVSNPVGDRDRSKWRLHEAADAAARALENWIEELGC